MKPLSRLESIIADVLERPAWALSSHKLHPLELTAALVKELERRAVRLADRVLAPDSYELRINPADLAAFGDTRAVLEQELAEYLRRTVVEREISMNQAPAVRLTESASQRQGRCQVVSQFSESGNSTNPGGNTHYPAARPAERPSPRVAQARRDGVTRDKRTKGETASAALELLDPAGTVLRQVPLSRSPLLIGRRPDADLSLVDGKVSRDHARVEQDRGGGSTVTDLSSLNGTLVNGEQIRGSRTLHDGDILEIGHFRLRFIAAGRS